MRFGRAFHLAVLLGVVLVASGASDAPTAKRNGFLAVSLGTDRIWRVDPATGRAVPLAEASQPDELAWSADGKTLAFNAQHGDRLTTEAVDANGRAVRIGVSGYALSFSPDGQRVVFQCPGLPLCIATSKLDGSDLRVLFNCRCAVYEPNWSPRGGRILYIRQHDRSDGGVEYAIRVRTLAGKDRALLAGRSPCISEVDASWSPDASRVAFVCESCCEPSRIYVAGADRGAPRAIAEGTKPVWAPDGTKLAFVRRNKSGSETLGVIDLRTSRVRALLTRGSIHSVAWQPVG